MVRTAGIGDIAGGLGIGNSSEQRRDGRREEKRSRLLHRIRDGVRTELCECVCQVQEEETRERAAWGRGETGEGKL